MRWDKISDWIDHVTTSYALKVYEFKPEFFLEDSLNHYIAISPIKNSDNGLESIKSGENGMVFVLSRYYVIFRLPETTDGIVRDCITIASKLGRPVSLTTDIRYLYTVFNVDQTPPKTRSFVAVEVEVTIPIMLKSNPCTCIMTCLSSE